MRKAITDIKISKSGAQSTCTISLEGELTVNSIGAFKQEMIEALNQCDGVQLKIRNATSIDHSWIQLWEALKKTCKGTGKDVVIEMILNPDQEILFARAGFASLLESSKSNNQTTR